MLTFRPKKRALTAAKFQPGRLAVRQVFPTLVSKLSRDKDVAVFIPADNLAANVICKHNETEIGNHIDNSLKC